MELINIVADVSLDEKLREHFHKVICELLEEVKEIADRFVKLPQIDHSVTLSATPISLKLTRRYSLLFLSKPTDLFIDISGIGRVLLSLQIGWNDISLPFETEVSLASDGVVSAIYRCIDTLP